MLNLQTLTKRHCISITKFPKPSYSTLTSPMKTPKERSANRLPKYNLQMSNIENTI